MRGASHENRAVPQHVRIDSFMLPYCGREIQYRSTLRDRLSHFPEIRGRFCLHEAPKIHIINIMTMWIGQTARRPERGTGE